MHGCTVMERDIARDQSHSPEMYGNAQRATRSLAALLNKNPLFVASKMYQNVRNDEKRR